MISGAVAEAAESTAGLALLAVAACGSLATAAIAWALLARARRVEAKLGKLAALDELATSVAKIAGEGERLDLRRIEHVLIDLRDGQKRTEERLLAIAEARASREPASVGPPSAGALAERVVGRLLALGYERVSLVTGTDDLARIALHGGDVVVEARRDGAACKGKVLVRGGSIHDVQLQSAYGIFP